MSGNSNKKGCSQKKSDNDQRKKGQSEKVRTEIPELKNHVCSLLNVGGYRNWLKKGRNYDINRWLRRRWQYTAESFAESVKSGARGSEIDFYFEELSENKVSTEDVASEDFTPEPIYIGELLKDIRTQDGGTKKCRKVLVVGCIGPLKNSLMARLCEKEEVLEGKIAIISQFHTIGINERISPDRAILASLFPKREEKDSEFYYQWICENSERVVILIPAFDTLPYDFSDERPRIENGEQATLDVILFNLLAGTLIPNISIIFGSRESRVMNLHPDIQPDRCVMINGLTKEGRDNVIDAYLGTLRGNCVRAQIETTCSNIWPIVSTPRFLEITIIAFSTDYKLLPDSFSGILIKFLSLAALTTDPFGSSTFFIFVRLMPLSYEAVCEGRSLLTWRDLRRFSIVPDMISDLEVTALQPGGNSLTVKLLEENNYYLFFAHQSLQDCLAAIWVVVRKRKEFKHFVQDKLMCPKFTSVSRIVCGILFNARVLNALMEMLQVQDLPWKKQTLLESIDSALGRCRQGELLDVFSFVLEGKEELAHLVRKSLVEIDFWQLSLSENDMREIAFIVSLCERLDLLRLRECKIDDKKLKILAEMLSVPLCRVKIDVIDLGDRPGKLQYSRILLDILPYVERDLIIDGWTVSERQKQTLQSWLNKSPSALVTIFIDGERLRVCPKDKERAEKIRMVGRKTDILRRSLRVAHAISCQNELLHLFGYLNEDKDGVAELVRASTYDAGFSEDEMEGIVSAVKQCDDGNFIRLGNCGIVTEEMNILTQTVKQSKLKTLIILFGGDELKARSRDLERGEKALLRYLISKQP